MELNYLAILLAVVAQFGIGFVWYGPLFGKIWGKIHGFDKLSKETQQKMMKEMGPFYGLQLLVTIITTVVLAIFITYQPDWNPYAMAAFYWFGFVVPAQISSVIFSSTPKEWMLQKIALQAGAAFLCYEVAATIITYLR
jgi:FtsH-binding integral membrane protein